MYTDKVEASNANDKQNIKQMWAHSNDIWLLHQSPKVIPLGFADCNLVGVGHFEKSRSSTSMNAPHSHVVGSRRY